MLKALSRLFSSKVGLTACLHDDLLAYTLNNKKHLARSTQSFPDLLNQINEQSS